MMSIGRIEHVMISSLQSSPIALIGAIKLPLSPLVCPRFDSQTPYISLA